MGVYIKGMEMPKNCGECRLSTMYGLPFAVDGWCIAMSQTEPNSELLAGTRPSWCPLIELPPHGRLIDADAFYKDINESILLTDGFKDAFNLWFDVQPTIIEAEGEE